jgi:hypothetical protein
VKGVWIPACAETSGRSHVREPDCGPQFVHDLPRGSWTFRDAKDPVFLGQGRHDDRAGSYRGIGCHLAVMETFPEVRLVPREDAYN